MTPYYQDPWLTVYHGDARAVMAEMEPESVHCVVTSPPYWGLRDYGTAAWAGGDAACDHNPSTQPQTRDVLPPSLANGPKDGMHGALFTKSRGNPARFCGKCGATRQDSQLGLEPTPEAYVESMVAVFREVRRVLRADGTVWLNLGSSYFNAGPGGAVGASGRTLSHQPERAPAYGSDGTGPQGSPGLGSAYPDLCDGCLAAQSSRTTGTSRLTPGDASLPSLTDRDIEQTGSAPVPPDASLLGAPASTTTLFVESPPAACVHCEVCSACLSVLRSSSRDARLCVRRTDDTSGRAPTRPTSGGHNGGTGPSALAWGDYTSTLKPKDMVPTPWMVAMALQADGWYLRSDIIWNKANPMPESVTDRPTKSHEYLFLLSKKATYYFDADAVREAQDQASVARYAYGFNKTGKGLDLPGGASHSKGNGADGGSIDPNPAGRNIRSVWTVATAPYPGAHFATFPPKLIEPCIKAGTSERGVCPECGAPWEREIGRDQLAGDYPAYGDDYRVGAGTRNGIAGRKANPHGGSTMARYRSTTTGWRPSCAHVSPLPPQPATVLDCFAGSGTTGMVAQSLSRRAVLIDLSMDYLGQLMDRNRDIPLGLGA